MRRELKNVLLLIALVLALAVVAMIVVNRASAEALPSPDAKAMLALSGDLRLSDAPVDVYVAECLRVDVANTSSDGVWAELELPYVPPGILSIALVDGFHMIHGVWQQTSETTLQVRFWANDIERLDGTIGIYLVVLAEGDLQ